MASEQSPVLFPARSPVGTLGIPSSLSESRESWPLIHALAATLNGPDPLLALSEVLGTYLGAGACLLLGHAPSMASAAEVVYTCWHRGAAPRCHRLDTAEAGSTLDWQRRVALGLIQQALDPSLAQGRLPWRKGLAELLRKGNYPPAWLTKMDTCIPIAVDGAGLQGVILLMGARGLSVDGVMQANLASLGAIAFHQHFLQGQAQRHTEQLRYLQYLKEDFLSTLNHELRTPLTSMMLAIRMLRRPDLSPERTAMYLDILEQQCTREINLVNDLLMLQTLETQSSPAPQAVVPSSPSGQTTDLSQLVHDLVDQSQPSFEQAQLTLEANSPPEAMTLLSDPEPLKKVLQELLGNACKYSAPHTKVTLDLTRGGHLPEQVTLRVSNQGAAIEVDELPHIFEKFCRGRNATRDGIAGTGTGLALVRRMVEQLGGTITVSSQPGDGGLWHTCFILQFEGCTAFS
jgi:signal transduction histidine kinase